MANKDTNALWVNSSGTRALRRPNVSKDENNEQKEKESFQSTLSVDAPEWYPSSYSATNVVPATTSNIQSRLMKHKLTTSLTQKQDLTFHNDSVNENSPDIWRMKQIIQTLINDPGQFDELLDIFMDTLCPYFGDLIILSYTARLLIDTAINNQNFRYTGARLCHHIEQYYPEFRAELHLTCKKKFAEKEDIQNVTLFVAELYTQLSHLNIYGSLLIDAFKQLLSIGGHANIKCVCQALKLTGYSLDASHKKDLDEVFNQLELLQPQTSGSALDLIKIVVDLRTSGWGYSSTPDTSNSRISTYPDDNVEHEDELETTLFYNTDGNTFTAEEAQFLAANYNINEDYFPDTSDPDELCNPEPEMDEEIQEAFKEFIKLSKR